MSRALKKIIKRLRIGEISLVDEPACPGADLVITKARNRGVSDDIEDLREDFLKASALAALTGGNEDMTDLEKRLAEIEAAQTELEGEIVTLKARAEKAEGERDAALAEVEKAKKTPIVETGDEDIFKGLPAALKERFETVEKRAKDAETRLETEALAREEGEFIAKARSWGLGDADEIGKLMVRIAKGKTTADDVAKVEDLMKSAARLAEAGSSLFKRLGGGGADADDPDAVVAAKVAEVRKAKPALSAEDAYTEVIEANPGLYDAVVAKQRRTRAAAANA